MLIIVYLTAMW